MTRQIWPVAALALLAGCNSMYIKPNTLDKTQTVYALNGGYSMRRSIKERMEERGYKIIVGKHVSDKIIDAAAGSSDLEIENIDTKSARYIVRVREREESFQVWWCVFNGFWWWNFNVSIADQKTGKELLTWRGRGCANSSLRKLDEALDQMEIK